MDSNMFFLSVENYQIIIVSNISNFTYSNNTLQNLINTTYITTKASNNYFSCLYILNNIIKSPSIYLSFLSISNYVYIHQLTAYNNSLNMPLLSNTLSLELLMMDYINLTYNIISDIENEYTLLLINKGNSLVFNDFYINNNIYNGPMIEILNFFSVYMKNMTFIENTSKFVFLIGNCLCIVMNAFLCHLNNQNSENNSYLSNMGSCLMISSSPYIEINSTKISYSLGLINIPGVVIDNGLIPSNITIYNTIFLNNIFNSSQKVYSYGCALYINNYPNLNLISNYFSYNYVLLINEVPGGPILYYIANLKSTVILMDCLVENSFSYKGSLVLEFMGFNLTITNCQFLNNLQHTYTVFDFYTQMLLNGIASYVIMYNSSIIDCEGSDGTHFLNERNSLTTIFNYTRFIYNSGYYCTGFNYHGEISNRNIILINSLYSNNTMNLGKGATFIYIYMCSPIIQYNFSIINTNVSLNYANPSSYGIIAFWTYCNNASFYMINSTIYKNIFASHIGQRFLISFYGIMQLIYAVMLNSSFIENISGDLLILYYQSWAIFDYVLFQGNDNIGIEPFLETEQCRLDMNNTVFYKNKMSGGFMYFAGVSYTYIKNTIFIDNIVETYYLFGLNNIELNLTNLIVNGTITNSDFNAFILLSSVHTTYFSNLTFNDNLGRFIYFFEVGSSVIISLADIIIQMKNLNFSEHIQYVFFDQCLGEIRDFNVISSNPNTIDSLIYLHNSVVNVSQVTIAIPYSKNNVFMVINLFKTEFSLDNSSFNALKLSTTGYFIYSLQSNVQITLCSFIKNANILYFKSNNISIANSSFSNVPMASSIGSSIITFQLNSYISLICIIFQNFLTLQSPIEINNPLYMAYIFNSSFLNNTAKASFGGVLSIYKTKLYIDSCLFAYNIAVRGGCIFLSCAYIDKGLCNFTLIGNNFMENSAIIDGGAIKYQYVAPITINNSFQGNKAVYGPDRSSYFCRLGLQINANNMSVFNSFKENKTNLIVLDKIFSKTQIIYEIRLIPLDDYNQIIYEKINDKVYVDVLDSINFDNRPNINKILIEQDKNNSFYCGYNKGIEYSGVLSQIQQQDFSFLFAGFQIISCPTSMIFLKFYSNFEVSLPVSYFPYKNSLNENTENSSYYMFLPIKIERCNLGEIFNPITTSCQICPEGYYSNINDTLTCKICLDNTYCQGGANFSLNTNFWNEPENIENIYHCNNFVGSCLGGPTSECLDGYEGVLCANCVSKEGSISYQDYMGNCTQCPNKFLILSIYAIIIGILVFILRKIIKVFDPKNKYKNDQKYAIKVFVNFLHLIIFSNSNYEYLDIDSGEILHLLENSKFLLKFKYFYISIECLDFLSNGNINPLSDIIFVTSVFDFSILCYIMYHIRCKTVKKEIFTNVILILYILLPIHLRILQEALGFTNINDIYVFRNNTNFSFMDLLYIITIFILPNILLCGVLLISYLFFHKKYKIYHEIINLGLENGNLYEKLNIMTYSFFFIINTIDFNVTLNHELNLFFYFYRVVSELIFCKFTNRLYKKISLSYKFIILLDYFIFLFLASNVRIDMAYPFLIIEIFFFLLFLIYLLMMLTNRLKRFTNSANIRVGRLMKRLGAFGQITLGNKRSLVGLEYKLKGMQKTSSNIDIKQELFINDN